MTSTWRGMRALVTLTAFGTLVLTGCNPGPGEEPAESLGETNEPDDAGSDEAADDADNDADTPTLTEAQITEAWATNATAFADGSRFEFACPAGGLLTSGIWGGADGTYTDDSSICVAAVHAGVITADKGGTVEVQKTPGLQTYGEGFEANGVTSRAWTTPWDASFTFP